MSRRSLIWLAGLAALTIIVHAVIGWSILPDSYDSIVNYMWVEVPIYALAVVIVLRDKGSDAKGTRRAVAFILVVAAILRVMLIPIDPESTDINRYVWDGRVQGAGINPYGHIPADPALKFLRDDDIYPDINRKEYAPTIYPPMAQIVFYLTTRVSEQIWVMKSVMVAFDAIAILAVMRLMKARNIPPTRILLYAWHPVPIWQFAADGHIDAVAIAGICLSLLAAEFPASVSGRDRVGCRDTDEDFARGDRPRALSTVGLETASRRACDVDRPLPALLECREEAAWILFGLFRRGASGRWFGPLSVAPRQTHHPAIAAKRVRALLAADSSRDARPELQIRVQGAAVSSRYLRRVPARDGVYSPDLTALHLVRGMARAIPVLLYIVVGGLAHRSRNLHE